MTNPKITVATATYNCVDCLEESILSVINQTYDNVEYIIMDGGSTDGTLQLLDKYRDRISIIVSERDNGIYDAMNKVLDLATGDFLIFMGADDHFLSWKTLEKIAPKLVDQNHTFYGNVFFEEYNLIHKRKINKFKRAVFNYCHQSIFYPKTAYKRYKYDLKYSLYADNHYNFIISKEYPFEYIGETVSFYAAGGASAVRKDEKWEKDEKSYIIKYCGYLPYLYKVIRRMIKE